MGARSFSDLARHVGHRLECIEYKRDGTTYNVSLECLDCNEVLMSFDNETGAAMVSLFTYDEENTDEVVLFQVPYVWLSEIVYSLYEKTVPDFLLWYTWDVSADIRLLAKLSNVYQPSEKELVVEEPIKDVVLNVSEDVRAQFPELVEEQVQEIAEVVVNVMVSDAYADYMVEAYDIVVGAGEE